MFFDSFTMTQRNVERQDLGPNSSAGGVGAELAPVLGATSDGRATAESSRALMVTLLGEFVLPLGGSAWTQTLLEAMESLGVQSKTSRQVLARLADRGWLDRTRDGRRTRWHLTPFAADLLRSGAARIYGFGHERHEWDGRWLVLLVSLHEDDQHLRYRMTSGLTWAGFGSLGQGTWISPWTDQEAAAVSVLDGLGIAGATTFVAEIGMLGHGDDLARRAWDLDVLSAAYDDFLADTTPRPTATRGQTSGTASADEVAELTTLVHRWRRFPFLDPELPHQLLPDDWPGRAAVDHFSARRAALLAAAHDWWTTTDAARGTRSTA